VALAKEDVETLKCIAGAEEWEFCTRARRLRAEVARLESRIAGLLENI